MKVCLDTMTWVRAAGQGRDGNLTIVNLARTSGATLISSEEILTEVRRVLHYPHVNAKYGLSAVQIRDFVVWMRGIANIVVPYEGPRIVPEDPGDDRIVYTALAGGADFLCTEDRHLFHADVVGFCDRRGIRVVTIHQLVRELRESSA